jgi:hypothetical protein
LMGQIGALEDIANGRSLAGSPTKPTSVPPAADAEGTAEAPAPTDAAADAAQQPAAGKATLVEHVDPSDPSKVCYYLSSPALPRVPSDSVRALLTLPYIGLLPHLPQVRRVGAPAAGLAGRRGAPRRGRGGAGRAADHAADGRGRTRRGTRGGGTPAGRGGAGASTADRGDAGHLGGAGGACGPCQRQEVTSPFVVNIESVCNDCVCFLHVSPSTCKRSLYKYIRTT